MTRRRFFFNCSTAVAALALVPMNSFNRLANSREDFQSLDNLSYPVLAGQINTPFRVRLSSGRVVELTLLKATLAPPTRATSGRRLPGTGSALSGNQVRQPGPGTSRPCSGTRRRRVAPLTGESVHER